MNIRNLRRLLLSVFVCFCVLFSNLHIANASDEFIYFEDEKYIYLDDVIPLYSNVTTLELTDDDISNGDMSISLANLINNNTWRDMVSETVFNNGFTNTSYYDHNTKYFTSPIPLRDHIEIKYNDTSKKVANKNDTINISLSNIIDYFYIDGIGAFHNDGKPSQMKVRFTGPSGEYYTVTPNYEISQLGNKYTLEIEGLNVPCDAYSIMLQLYYTTDNYMGLSTYYGQDLKVSKVQGFSDTYFSISVEDETKGLLSSIIEWLQSIRDNIINLPQKIANSIKGFFDNIVNKLTEVLNGIKSALVELGNFIIDGIKGLFVPNEETMLEVKDKWDELLSSRFGALYEVIQLIDDYAETFKDSKKGSIMFPTVCIPLGECEFEFGGWEVQIVPEGFDVVFDALKLITSICATVLFINGLRNRFERIIGRE